MALLLGLAWFDVDWVLGGGRAVTKTVDRRRYSQPLRLKYQYTPAPANTIDSNDSG